jgi:hypothetical protein
MILCMCSWMTVRVAALIIAAMLASATAYAQVYSCTAEDGTRIFSDKRCGADAKLVKDIATKRPATKAKSTSVQVAPKSAEELQSLLERCNAGDGSACMTWTKGGGPKQLRALEKEQELSCEAGSLTACEQRYCRDGATADCRERVRALATVSGANWYLRFQHKRAADAPAVYAIRCLGADSRQIHDITVSCAPNAGPQRCQSGTQSGGFPKLDVAAAAACSVAR